MMEPLSHCRGHNELDNPSLTQPVMYSAIESRLSVPDMYARELEVSSSVVLVIEC